MMISSRTKCEFTRLRLFRSTDNETMTIGGRARARSHAIAANVRPIFAQSSTRLVAIALRAERVQ